MACFKSLSALVFVVFAVSMVNAVPFSMISKATPAGRAISQGLEDNPDVTFNIVESIPLGVDLKTDMTYFQAMYDVVNSAQHNLDIACMYMTFSNDNTTIGGEPGQMMYDAIVAAAKRGVHVRIAKSVSGIFGYDDVEKLVNAGYAVAAYVNYTHLIGAGILHTKFIIADNRTFSVGSANMDWRSLTQVKEFGIYFPDAPAVAMELDKVFTMYWILGTANAVPKQWPDSLQTAYTIDNPMQLTMNGTASELFFSLSPPPCEPTSWTWDSAAITSHMFAAEEFIWIEVMDYMPALVYVTPSVYWNTIDNAIRKASYNNKTQVRLLIGYWDHSMPLQQNYVQSLNALPNVTVKYFIVPPYKVNIPYTRVNHAKWMVTDQSLFIDTSNWTGDYFTNTAGVGTNTNNVAAQRKGVEVFLRDWNSQYTHDIPASG